jgi:hypothetical protein
LAAEVLQLGQTLFDSLLEGMSPSGEGERQPEVDCEEARGATDEFFKALRLLLGLEASSA